MAAWFPPDPEKPDIEDLTNLFAILGERAYLIKLTGEENVIRTLVGEPKLPRIRWQPNSPNLVGFHLSPGNEPTFADFFAPSVAHGNDEPEAYRLNSVTGEWEAVEPTTQMQRGEAYWVLCDMGSDYTGPLTVKARGGGLDFGKRGVELDLGLRNHAENPRSILVRPQASSPLGPSVGGMVPLSYWIDPPEGNAGWNEVSGAFTLEYEAEQNKALQLAVRRTALPGTGVYQSLLEISDYAGMRILVPVSTGEQVIETTQMARGLSTTTTDSPPDRTGLWVGSAIINAVNEAADAQDPTTPKPTASEFIFRLILHVDDDGEVRLLREVAQLWKPPVTDEDGIEIEEDREGLFTDEENLTAAMTTGNFIGVGIRDGRGVGRRISAAAFSFPEPLLLEGTFEVGQTLSGTYTVGFDDPLNPFKHQYHPDHDNKNAYFDAGPEDRIPEAYEFDRSFTLEFTAEDPTNLDLAQAGWDDIAMAGIYREEISGVSGAPCFKLTDLSFQQLKKVDVDVASYPNYSTMVTNLKALENEEYCLGGPQEFDDGGEPVANPFLNALPPSVKNNPMYPFYKGHILKYAYRPKMTVQGMFRLQKVSDVGLLNDGQ